MVVLPLLYYPQCSRAQWYEIHPLVGAWRSKAKQSQTKQSHAKQRNIAEATIKPKKDFDPLFFAGNGVEGY